jgi:putative addiction module CopG family antidote
MASIHEAADGLHAAGVMDKQTMRKFDDACLTPVLPLTPDDIRSLREREGASQAVFARYLNVSTGPLPLKQFVDGEISTGHYSSVSEYVRELIRADEKRKAEEVLEAKLLEGLNSIETELTPEDWSAIGREALSKTEERKQAR